MHACCVRVRDVFFLTPKNLGVQEVDQFDFAPKLAENVDVLTENQ